MPTLIIMAAGMATRYGSLKQIASFGPSGETMLDYAIYDAIKAGFTKVVFIIRSSFADEFKDIFEPKLRGRIAMAYVYQELHNAMEGVAVPALRTKPWGTGHALLCARPAVNGPFAIINADDFYGYDTFAKAASFLQHDCHAGLHANIGFTLSHTLSEHGAVSRGICETNAAGLLTAITERTNIYATEQGIVYEENGERFPLAADTTVSMNCWCFHPSIFAYAAPAFQDFLAAHKDEPKTEFYITSLCDGLLKSGAAGIRLIPTQAQWFGVTYKEDAPFVQAHLDQLIDAGAYPPNLWGVPAGR
ncbi:MAG TPA: sugar phosphate nucleotidyltransferase [Chitinophaga sp.]